MVGSVGPAAELRGVEQVNQCVLEVAGGLPLPLVPRGQFVDGQDAGYIGGSYPFEVAQRCQAFALLALQQAFDLFRTDLRRGKVSAVRQVEFLIGQQAGACEVGGANDGRDRTEALEAATTVEQVALGVQETAGVEAYLHVFLAQEGDEVFDQAQGLFVEVLSGQVAYEPFDGFRADFAQAEI